MFWNFPLKIQRWDSIKDEWGHVEFQNKLELVEFIKNSFKLPGKYNLTEKISNKIQEEGRKYASTAKQANFQGGRYHNYIKNSSQYNKWKDIQKDRIKNGVIYDELFIPAFYYNYVNYCPIYNDKLKKTQFGDIWDSDIWYMQYIMICMLLGRNVIGLKARQRGYSFKHVAILYWCYCWSEGSINTIGGFEQDLVSKSWRFMETYRNHINKYTPWKRGPVRPKALEWLERTDLTDGGFHGLNSKLSGVTFKQSPTKDVGGNQTIFNYEEPGVSPTLLETFEFIKPAQRKGSEVHGIFIANGSVGKLEDADGLKEMFYNITKYYGYPLKNIWDDDAGETDVCGIFISEAYNMDGNDYHIDDYGNILEGSGKSFIDKAGNSDVELALKWIKRNEEILALKPRTNKDNELDQIAKSQKCISPAQAFAERKNSFFPVEKLRRRQEQIKILEQAGKLKPSKGLLFIDNDGGIKLSPDKGQEHQYPIKPEWSDKRGCTTIYKWPEENPKLFRYFAGIDTVEADETTTSDSIQTVDIFEGGTIVKNEFGKILRTEGDRLVATYRGRFNPVDGGNEQAELLIRLYNAYCYQERSKPNFQTYMKKRGLAERYLAKESEVNLNKDVNMYKQKTDAGLYGFTMSHNNDVWKTFKTMGKEYMFSEYGSESHIDEKGNTIITKIYTGIDLIDDYWLIEEFIAYAEDSQGRPKKNTDRLVSFLAALTISRVFLQNSGNIRIEYTQQKKVDKQVYSPKPINMLGGFRKNNYNNTKGVRRPISMI